MPKTRTKPDRREARSPTEAAPATALESVDSAVSGRPSGVSPAALPGAVVRAYGKFFAVQLTD
ncbi:MAG TPA: hypothetical protein VKB09_02600, partial [Thermomicrobiales bacterium]|nr:hypothetical protein [Thermomicrobiales bacterium]